MCVLNASDAPKYLHRNNNCLDSAINLYLSVNQ